MKTLLIIPFLYFIFFTAIDCYAGNNNLTAAYPASSGSYNKVILQNLQGSPATICQAASNSGLLFMYTDLSGNQTLEMCTNGINVAVPYPETCFNRFCSWQDYTANPPAGAGYIYCSGPTSTPLHGCPPGYSWAATSSNPIQDILTTYTVVGSPNYYYHVESTVCCNTGSTVNPSVNP